MNAITRSKTKTFRFEDGEETISVRTDELPNGEYIAYDLNDLNPTFPIGHGFSTIGAIANLFEKLPRAASEREEIGHQTARWNRARDLQKHGG